MNKQDFMEAAWRDFILWAVGNLDIRAQFTRATGMTFLPPSRTPIEAAIDQATGAETATLEAFVRWATVTLWGEEHAPAAYRVEAERLRRGDAKVADPPT